MSIYASDVSYECHATYGTEDYSVFVFTASYASSTYVSTRGLRAYRQDENHDLPLDNDVHLAPLDRTVAQPPTPIFFTLTM